MSPSNIIALISLIISLLGCAHQQNNVSNSFHPNPPWSFINSSNDEIRISNSDTSSLVVLQKLCGNKKEKSSQSMHRELLKKLSQVEMIFREENVEHSISTIRSHFRGIMSEYQSFLVVTTFKDHRCFYDLAMISQRQDKFEDDLEFYNDFLEHTLINLNK